MNATEGMWATAIMQVIAYTMGIVVDQRNSPGEFVTAPAGQPSGGLQWQHHTHQAARELHDAGDRLSAYQPTGYETWRVGFVINASLI